MREVAEQLTPEEQAAAQREELRFLIRVAEECDQCGGSGYVLDYPRDQNGEFTGEGQHFSCESCHGTGYASPYAPGDVLVAEWECTKPFFGGGDMTYRHAVRLTVEDVRLVRLWEAPYTLPAPAGQWSPNEVNREHWDRNNPEHPWASNPMVRVVGLKPEEKK